MRPIPHKYGQDETARWRLDDNEIPTKLFTRGIILASIAKTRSMIEMAKKDPSMSYHICQQRFIWDTMSMMAESDMRDKEADEVALQHLRTISLADMLHPGPGSLVLTVSELEEISKAVAPLYDFKHPERLLNQPERQKQISNLLGRLQVSDGSFGFFLADTGHIGRVSHETEPNDQICFFQGVDIPLAKAYACLQCSISSHAPAGAAGSWNTSSTSSSPGSAKRQKISPSQWRSYATFYELVKMYHPDRHSHHIRRTPDHPIATLSRLERLERYRLVVRAHEILSDPDKRRAYDVSGAGWDDHGIGNPRDASARSRSRARARSPSADADSCFENATWEDWERWYARTAQPQHAEGPQAYGGTFLNPNMFASVVIVLAIISAIFQATHVSQFSGSIEDRAIAFTAQTQQFLSERRADNSRYSHMTHTGHGGNLSDQGGSRSSIVEERIKRFLERRDPYRSGLKDEEIESYRQAFGSNGGGGGAESQVSPPPEVFDVSPPPEVFDVSPPPEVLDLPPPAYDEGPTLGFRALSQSWRPTRKPIVIPCVTGKTGSPFLRCYAPVLDQYHLPEEVFLKYLDYLNTIAVASAPMQALGMAHEAARMVSIPAIQLVGGVISALAKISSMGYSYGRMELALRELNRDVFGPRGLKMEIASMRAVARLAGMPVLDASGRLRTDVSLLGDLPAHDVDTVSGLERRLNALAPWIEELREVAPEPEASMWRTATTKMSDRERWQHETLLLDQRRTRHYRYTTQLDSWQRNLNIKLDEVDRQQADIISRQDLDAGMKEAQIHRLEEQRRRHQEDFRLQKQRLHRDKVDQDVEEREMRSTVWLVISVVDKALGRTTWTRTASENGRSRPFRRQPLSPSATTSQE
ncbi:hypothetical protein DV737_g2327, partial [Chaetothyriales sp. CBS 132003]